MFALSVICYVLFYGLFFGAGLCLCCMFKTNCLLGLFVLCCVMLNGFRCVFRVFVCCVCVDCVCVFCLLIIV